MTLKVFLTDKYKEVNDTRIFDTLKARITVPQAAAYYLRRQDRAKRHVLLPVPSG